MCQCSTCLSSSVPSTTSGYILILVVMPYRWVQYYSKCIRPWGHTRANNNEVVALQGLQEGFQNVRQWGGGGDPGHGRTSSMVFSRHGS